ncbi:MAG: hypothetical protein JWP42_4163 [Pseudomonas sp.]|nr:hypothetical protein [Pseudomonas sp.]
MGDAARQLIALIYCRSRLAGDGGVSGDMDAGGAGAFASKLAPTGIFSEQKFAFTTDPL